MTSTQSDGTAVRPQTGPPIAIDIWSDVACPWCYLGKRRLESALADWEGEVTVTYHSFELSPDTPGDYAGTTTEYLSEKKGMPVAKVEEMLAHVTQLAAAEGLEYRFDEVKHRRTLLAHQLLHLAKARGKQAEVKERLMAAYFERGVDVASIDELVEIGADAHLDPADVRAALESEEYVQDVVADIARGRALGIQGVPFFVFDQKYGVSGAQAPATFTQVLTQVAQDRAAAES
ncbi:DSBA oxidoreductase [Paraoerskovia sediminicola]|uniref:DSBA oxidoreductase n=1 Tax=Paraoerskovia sediminicola TaxID=1138587 RepID=A0ABN6XFD8_9CELL|nr:DsbA family oxidoreductase [Paraoerskovia sediminicola]BDZ42316.1 DSBA oxidoreductase [Paraoerskovia sediminicola]